MTWTRKPQTKTPPLPKLYRIFNMANAHTKMIEALLPEDADAEEMQNGEGSSSIPPPRIKIVDSDASHFDWRTYYACALANMIDIHLSTLEARRVELASSKKQKTDACD